ncbi:MAG TPA: isoprenylcysteine carboxylmethyltransferase family protein [Candidatus Binatia bacterium]
MAALIFLPAGTLDYWQGWVFFAFFFVGSSAIGLYLAIDNPVLLERRMKVGPTAEKEPSQKIIILFALLGFITLLVFPALDHRFGWSPVPPYGSVAGDALVALGFILTFGVIRQNNYAASTIQVVEGQKVVSTGLYAYVRHPMYAGVLPMIVGMPLALGSWWSLFGLVLVVPAIIWRLLDEEKFLHKNLRGYTEYTKKVRYRLIPFIW